MQNRKLKTLSVKDKLKLLEEIDKGNKLKKEIAAQYGIPASTLSTILKNRATFQKNVVNCNSLINPAKKRFTKCVFADVDKCMLQWTVSMQKRNVKFTSDMIRQKAKDYALLLGHERFRASTGWLEKFKARHGILQRDDKNNSETCGSSDFSSSVLNVSLKGGQSMNCDHKGTKLVISECPENITPGAIDYLDLRGDVIVEEIKIEEETLLENVKSEVEDFLYIPPKRDETLVALRVIHDYLNNQKNVPEDVSMAFCVIEEYVEEVKLD